MDLLEENAPFVVLHWRLNGSFPLVIYLEKLQIICGELKMKL